MQSHDGTPAPEGARSPTRLLDRLRTAVTGLLGGLDGVTDQLRAQVGIAERMTAASAAAGDHHTRIANQCARDAYARALELVEQINARPAVEAVREARLTAAGESLTDLLTAVHAALTIPHPATVGDVAEHDRVLVE